MNGSDSTISLAILLLAAVVHASFQLSVSVLTLLSGHALGRKTAHNRLVNLSGAYLLGAGIMTVLLLSSLAWVLSLSLTDQLTPVLWALLSGALVGVGVSVWLFYYKNQPGTTLWIPRGFAQFLSDRAKHSKSLPEVFGLGMTGVFAELLFLFAPLVVAALVLIQLDPSLQLPAVIAYCGISLLPLLVVGVLVTSGRKLSRIQKWREQNKRFLQFTAGAGLVILGVYIYVEQFFTVSVMAAGGQ